MQGMCCSNLDYRGEASSSLADTLQTLVIATQQSNTAIVLAQNMRALGTSLQVAASPHLEQPGADRCPDLAGFSTAAEVTCQDAACCNLSVICPAVLHDHQPLTAPCKLTAVAGACRQCACGFPGRRCRRAERAWWSEAR